MNELIVVGQNSRAIATLLADYVSDADVYTFGNETMMIGTINIPARALQHLLRYLAESRGVEFIIRWVRSL